MKPSIDPGLCGQCLHGESLSSRTSTFLRCARSAADPAFARYPVLPRTSCSGFEPVVPGRIGLEDLGWTAERAAQFAALAGSHKWKPARVIAQLRGVLLLFGAEGEVESRASGRMRRQAVSALDMPAVGDWVAYEPPASGSIALIRAVLERRSAFVRKAAGEGTEPQVVAANIDQILLVTPLGHALNRRRLERFLAFAAESRADARVVLSKADLATPEAAAEAQAFCAELGVPAALLSVRSGEGLREFERSLEPRKSYALVGASGAGKSTLANVLCGSERMRTGEVLEDGRGQHTTSHRELLRLPAGAILLDTPGLRELQTWDLDEGLAATFDDIEELAGACRFSDCRHRAEPGCAVLHAIEEGRMATERLASFHKLQAESAAAARKRDDRARLDEKRHAKALDRALQARLREKYK